MCERYWEARWELVDGPCAKAYRLLRSIDVGPKIGSTAGRVWNFIRALTPVTAACGSMQWTSLSLSLLQARLIDLKMPIKIVEGT